MKSLDASNLPSEITPTEEVLEAVFEHDNKILVFSTANTPFEEELVVQLFTADGRELESVSLCDEYAPAQFRIASVNDDSIEFRFWSDDILRLTCHSKPRRVLLQPVGVHYKKRLAAKHLLIEKPQRKKGTDLIKR